jgi:hypothetical protein
MTQFLAIGCDGGRGQKPLYLGQTAPFFIVDRAAHGASDRTIFARSPASHSQTI